MPTRDNCLQLDSLIDATTALVEAKRLMDKLDFDIRVAKTRLGMRDSQGAEGEGEGEAEGNNGDSMDVDEGNEGGEGEGGRAESVLSARSARSRKHVS